jgi:DNA-binding MarR family transcriptional regulator
VDDVRWLTEDEMRAWRSLVVVGSRLFEQLDAELRREHDLSLADYEILSNLSEAPCRRLRMSQLAALALVSRSRLTHHVSRMEAEGLVVREACDTDRRGAFAVLTDDGMARVEAAAPTHLAGVRRMFLDRVRGSDLPVVARTLAGVAGSLAPADGGDRGDRRPGRPSPALRTTGGGAAAPP